jgi:NTP pyrophosphatase (non-canonical NTP hydrolase)
MSEVSLELYQEFVMSVMSSKSKTLAEFIEVLDNLEKQGVNAALLNTAVAGLSGETGEFSDIVKKVFFQGKEFDSTTREKLEKELGDIIFYWITGCHALGLDPNEVISLNVKKLSARYPGGFSVERSEVRAKNDY